MIAERDPASPTQPTGHSRIALAVVVLFGLGAALSPFFAAYYPATRWVPIGLGLVVAATVGLAARPWRITGPAAMVLGGLLSLGMWALASAAWAQSVESAIVDGNLLLVYGAALVVLLTVLRTERRCAWLIVAMRAGIVVVALWVIARMLGGDPAPMFLTGRLNSPLGYINGEGCLFVIGFWLCWAGAERSQPAEAGLAAAGATLMACLALLSESRGTALAMGVSAAAVVVLVPGRRARAAGLMLLGLAVALAGTPLLNVFQQSATGPLPVAAAHAAARAIVLASLAVGVAWAAACAVYGRFFAAEPARARRLRRTMSVAFAALGLACVIAAAASAGRIERSASSQWHAFTHLAPPVGTAGAADVGQSRLISGAGKRYDFWRVAWTVWRSNPVVGVGGGNYGRPYFMLRSTTEDVVQPHSLELQTLSELGLVGGALLLVFLVGIAAGARRMRRIAVRSSPARRLLVGALGTSVAWLTQTSVDWMHLLPGLTAIALGGIAILVVDHRLAAGPPAAENPRLPRRPAIPLAPSGRTITRLGLAGVLVALVAAGASLGRQALADLFRARAQADVATHPAAALAAANRSLNFDPDAVASYYVKAAALARFNDGPAARAVLRTALSTEPDNFVTWTLLGDIAAREGRLPAAKADYGRALALNPRDPSLSALAADPRAAAP